MSDEETNKETTIVPEEVSVTKRLELEEFDDPVVAFDIESRRDEPATVTVVDDIPEDISPRDLRFHPEYGSEHWVIDDGELVFEREFDPDEEYVTVYRLCDTRSQVVNSFADPDVTARTGIEAGSGAGKTRGMVRSANATTERTDGKSIPDLDTGEEPAEDEDVPTLELDDPAANERAGGGSEPAEDRTTTVMTDTASEASETDTGDQPENEPEDNILSTGEDDILSEDDSILGESEDDDSGDSEGDDDILSEGDVLEGDEDDVLSDSEDDGDDQQEAVVETGAESTEESLVAALAAELEDGTVPEDDVERLRAALGQEGPKPNSTVVRVEKLQRDVDEVLAYTEALAEFLDENGTGEEVITEFQEEVDDFHEEVERFETDLEAVETAAERTDGRIDELESEVEDEFEDVQEDLAGLREDIGDIRTELEDGRVDERLSELEQNVENLSD